MEIKRIQIHSSGTDEASKIAREVIRLVKEKFDLVSSDPDVIIVVGGDGTFLQAVQMNDFDTNPIYIGINAGHLGFLQEVTKDTIALLLSSLEEGNFKTEQLNLAEIKISTSNGVITRHALNEVLIRESNFKVLHTEVYIGDGCLEHFAGDGVMISTPTGSTAYNQSLGGSIIYPGLNVLQLTPVAPLNSSAYRSLLSSVIVPENTKICIAPEYKHRDNTLIIVDGEVVNIPSHVTNVDVTTADKKLTVIRFGQYDFWTRVKDKFLN